MAFYIAVPDGDIIFEPKLDEDEFVEFAKDLKKAEGLQLDKDGIFMNVYEWYSSTFTKIC